jgi:hypothetical protein
MMNLVEIFLPLDKGSGAPTDGETIEGIVKGLADRFGGATAFTREAADGLWKRETAIERDRIIIIEVVVRDLDEAWWKNYQRRLEQEFAQFSIMIRVTPCRLI